MRPVVPAELSITSNDAERCSRLQGFATSFAVMSLFTSFNSIQNIIDVVYFLSPGCYPLTQKSGDAMIVEVAQQSLATSPSQSLA